jgi:hypothetical protein
MKQIVCYIPHGRSQKLRRQLSQKTIAFVMLHLEKLDFELKWLREQSYDNGANMKEGRKSVQNKILEKYPRVFYVLPCPCHLLIVIYITRCVSELFLAKR